MSFAMAVVVGASVGDSVIELPRSTWQSASLGLRDWLRGNELLGGAVGRAGSAEVPQHVRERRSTTILPGWGWSVAGLSRGERAGERQAASH